MQLLPVNDLLKDVLENMLCFLLVLVQFGCDTQYGAALADVVFQVVVVA